jgi:stage V sporulation protein S
MVDIMKVAAKSRPGAVAGAIAGVIRANRRTVLQAIGAGAVYQAVKAIVISRNYLQRDGLDIVCIPSFVDIDVAGEERTAIKFAIEAREISEPTDSSTQSEPNLPAGTSINPNGRRDERDAS